ncbi:MAG: ribosome-associated translation inhibitor RaiA [Bacteroidetes bacterium]|nr:ribosome-associated translation inhibitor RaiA [Bacteroidota bacterium]MBL6962575.1 ribosome-associated translation inhibitor RaiA [Bacteroidota bacterium]
MKIDIHAKNIRVKDSLKELINSKVKKLSNFHAYILDTDVYLRNEGEGLKSNEVQIKLNIKNQVLVSKEKGNTFEQALEIAVGSMKRQLKKAKQK